MNEELKGRIALVTGAGRGIGRAIALALAGVGVEVAVNYRRDAVAAATVCEEIRELGRRTLAVPADVTRADEVEEMVATVRRDLGPITILVNNAGIAGQRGLDEIDEAAWDETLAVNLKGVFLVTQAVLPDMRAAGWGRVVGLSSIAAQVGGVVGPHYAASKGGVCGLMHYYASRLAGEGITANAIAPGPIATEMVAGLPVLKPEMMPVGRFGTPEEVARLVVMLVETGYITGQTFNINGGRYFA